MLSVHTALSGMQAASTRVSATASNIANIDATGALPPANAAPNPNAPQPYQPVQVQQSSIAGSGPNGGGGAVVTTVRNVSPSYVAAYEPSATYADANGIVAAPNINETNEIVNLVTAENDFSLNAKVLQTINDMVKKLYDLG